MPTLNARLKILHILDHSLPLHSGYAFRSQNIFRVQRQRGWQPVVLTSPKHEASWHGPWYPTENLGGVRYYRTGAIPSRVLPLLAEGQLLTALARRLRQVAAEEHPDILHAHSPVLNALPALWVGHTLRLPVVYEIRAFWEDAAVDHGTYSQDSWQYWLVRALETWVCRQASHMTVLCHGLKDDLIHRGIAAEKLTVVCNGINLDDFGVCAPDPAYRHTWNLGGKKVIGFIGSFYHYEGLDLLVRAMATLTQTRSDLTLLLVGGGPMESALKEQIHQLQLEDHVVLAGRIPHKRIPGIYALIDILAYPRYAMRLTELVTPLKPLEAMAMGKALVASDIGGHRELIHHGQTGLLFPAGDVTALAAALTRLLEEDSLRQHLATQGAAWVCQEHTWDKTTDVYTDVYTRVLEKRHAA